VTDLEHQLIEELHFTMAYDELMSRIDIKSRAIARTELERLIRQGLISQMQYSSARNDFEKLDSLDSRLIETSYFVATRRGLMAHNGMA
jgi:hypothetical protein